MLWEPTDHVYGARGTTPQMSWEELSVIHWFLEFFHAVSRRQKTPGHLDFQFWGRVYPYVFLMRTEQLFSQQFPAWANCLTQSSLPKAIKFMAQIPTVPKQELLSLWFISWLNLPGTGFRDCWNVDAFFCCCCWVLGIFFFDLVGKMKPYEIRAWVVWASSFLYLTFCLFTHLYRCEPSKLCIGDWAWIL